MKIQQAIMKPKKDLKSKDVKKIKILNNVSAYFSPSGSISPSGEWGTEALDSFYKRT